MNRLQMVLGSAFLTVLAACETTQYGTPPPASTALAQELEALGLPNARQVGFNLARPPHDSYREDYQERMAEFEKQKALLIQAVKNDPQAVLELSDAIDEARERYNGSRDLDVKAAASKEMSELKAQVAVIAGSEGPKPMPQP